MDIVRKALRIPCYQIASNAGVDASEVVNTVMHEKPEIGYDAMNNEYVDMIQSGIIDPTKVSQSPLFHNVQLTASSKVSKMFWS